MEREFHIGICENCGGPKVVTIMPGEYEDVELCQPCLIETLELRIKEQGEQITSLTEQLKAGAVRIVAKSTGAMTLLVPNGSVFIDQVQEGKTDTETGEPETPVYQVGPKEYEKKVAADFEASVRATPTTVQQHGAGENVGEVRIGGGTYGSGGQLLSMLAIGSGCESILRPKTVEEQTKRKRSSDSMTDFEKALLREEELRAMDWVLGFRDVTTYDDWVRNAKTLASAVNRIICEVIHNR